MREHAPHAVSAAATSSAVSGGAPLLWPFATTTVLAALPAVFWAVALWDRTSLAGLSRQWAGTFLLVAGALVVWTWAARAVAGWSQPMGLLPASLVAGLLVLAIYASDGVHHAFVFQPLLKGLFLPIVGILCLAAPVFTGGAQAWGKALPGHRLTAAAGELRDALCRHERLVIALALVFIGALQAAAYCAVATDDSIRYWAVADGLRSGAGYPVTTGAAGSEGFYLVELPLYPLLLLGSFTVAGHRFLALELPLLAANVALPLLFYALARLAGAARLTALWLAVALLCLPYYQSYALGAAQPEPLLAVELGTALWLALSLTRVSTRHSQVGRSREILPPAASDSPIRWTALGLICAAAALTRPEGVLYVGPLFVALAWHYRPELLRGQARGIWLAAACFALPVGAFSWLLWRRFGILWPAGWTNVAGPQFLATNIRLALQQDLPHYAAVAGLPAPAWSGPLVAAALLALIAAGMWRLCRARPALWFVPGACLVNLAVIFDSPSYLTPDLFSPGTFFRHISVTFPWLVPALAALITIDERRKRQDESSPPVDNSPSAYVFRPFAALGAGSSSLLLAVGAVGLLFWELAVLGGSAARNQAGRPTVLTSDIYVLVSDLARVDDRLPALPFGRDVSGIAAVDVKFDYMAFRGRLFEAVRPYDLHVNDAGRAFEIATGVVALAGLGALALARDSARRLSGSVALRFIEAPPDPPTPSPAPALARRPAPRSPR